MKGIIRFAYTITLVLLAAFPLVAQAPQTYEAETDHYRVVSEVSRTHARATADQLEAMILLFNEQFRFPLEELTTPLRVRIFANQDRYDEYLNRLINEQRRGFVYLHYRDIAKSELVGYYTDDASLTQSMIHQSFVQYFRSFVKNPPLWLREGFAVYYESVQYDQRAAQAMYQENLAWLDTLKEMTRSGSPAPLLPLERILSMDSDDARENLGSFYPQAWGMVSFLLNAEERNANRILWDSISALSPEATLEDNINAVYEKAFRWVDQEELVSDFLEYLDSRRTFYGWVSYGTEQFEAGELTEAERAFTRALDIREDNYVPYYYLGLINYEKERYPLADSFYQEAMATGAEEALTLYALGVNAYADNRFDDAITYLEETIDADVSYREKAEELLIRLRN